MKETIEALRQEVSNMESMLNSMKKRLEQLERENVGREDKPLQDEVFSNGKQLLAKVAKKGELVRLYGINWYVLNIKNRKVVLISKDSVTRFNKNTRKCALDSCSQLDNCSQRYVEFLCNNKKILHSTIRSCTIHDIEQYLGRKVKWGDDVYDNIWNIYVSYWLASPSSANIRHLLYVDYHGHVCSNGGNEGSYHGNFGVRPVITLKSNVCITGKNEDGIWILEE